MYVTFSSTSEQARRVLNAETSKSVVMTKEARITTVKRAFVYSFIFTEKVINRKLEHSQRQKASGRVHAAGNSVLRPKKAFCEGNVLVPPEAARRAVPVGRVLESYGHGQQSYGA